MQDTNKTIDENTNLSTHLQGLSIDERKIWIKSIKNNLEQGDMKLVAGLTGHKYYQVRQVLQGVTYNPSFAPEIIEITLNIISARKRAQEETELAVDQFFHDFLKVR